MTKQRIFQEFIKSRGLSSEAGGEFIDYAKAVSDGRSRSPLSSCGLTVEFHPISS